MSNRRVVVTGLGLLSPVGNNVNSSRNNIILGLSGVKPITTFDVSDCETKFAATVEVDTSEKLDKKEIRRTDPFIQYGLIASQECLEDSLIDLDNTDLNRFGVSIGSGIGGLGTIEENKIKLSESGPKKISPFFVPGAIANMVSGYASLKYGLKGPNISIASACSSASHSIGYSFRNIVHGDADLMLTGGAEMATTPLGIAGFNAAKALSTNNSNPEAASRPWDKDRDGFVLGEGAGCLLLEEYEHAKSRGAKIYAELVGYGATSDGHDMVQPSGEGAERCMMMAIKNLNEKVDYINAHGTSTPVGDNAELGAVKKVFGNDSPFISSTKSLTGHSLGAAGVQEAIYSLLMLNNNFMSESAHIQNLDEAAKDMNILTSVKEGIFDTAMSNSFGFGGTNASLVFRRYN